MKEETVSRRMSNTAPLPEDTAELQVGAAAGALPDLATSPLPDPVLMEAQAEIESGAGQPWTGAEPRRLAVNVIAGGGANLVKIVLQLVMLPVMARLLGPAEFGIYALALPTVAFFITLADGGLGVSLAREQTSSPEIWSTAFWLVLMVGVALTLTTAGWGVVLAHLSHEPRVTGVMALLSLSFLFVTGSVVPYARLTRERRLVAISGADLAGNLVGVLVALSLALSGAGAMSLAGQYVTLYFVRAVILNSLAFVPPSLIFQPSILRSHMSTGSSLVCSRLADFTGRLTENLVFGRTFGPAALGTFTFANQVPRFVCEAASGPLWAALYSHALREDSTAIGSLHAKLVRILTLVLAPIAFLTTALVPSLMQLLLGPEWTDAAAILAILIPFYALNALVTQGAAVLLARGFGWTMFSLGFLLVFGRVVAVLIGPWIGPTGVAWGIGAAQVVYTLAMMRVHSRLGLSPLGPLLRGTLAPILAAMAGGLVCHFIVREAPTQIPHIVLAFLAGGACYLGVLIMLERKRLRDDIAGARKLLRR